MVDNASRDGDRGRGALGRTQGGGAGARPQPRVCRRLRGPEPPPRTRRSCSSSIPTRRRRGLPGRASSAAVEHGSWGASAGAGDHGPPRRNADQYERKRRALPRHGLGGQCGEPLAAAPKQPTLIPFASGAALAVRREAWGQLGASTRATLCTARTSTSACGFGSRAGRWESRPARAWSTTMSSPRAVRSGTCSSAIAGGRSSGTTRPRYCCSCCRRCWLQSSRCWASRRMAAGSLPSSALRPP